MLSFIPTPPFRAGVTSCRPCPAQISGPDAIWLRACLFLFLFLFVDSWVIAPGMGHRLNAFSVRAGGRSLLGAAPNSCLTSGVPLHHGPFDQRAGAWAGCARIGPLVQRHLSAPRRGSREDTTEMSLRPQHQLRQRPSDETGRHARLRSGILGVRLSPGAPVFERTVFLDVAQPGQRSRLGSERSVVRIHPSRPSDWGVPQWWRCGF